ncbi:MAG: adenylosuccinate lyase [Nitrososphaerales archaeon]|nr:adenylosuccinate lyase [Nitrososphaerales archaeon]
MKPTRPKNGEGRFGYDTYLSPFTWRYGSEEMRKLFSEEEKRATWRKVWLALAEAQQGLGLLTEEEVRDIRSKSGREHVDIRKAHALEKKIRHDLMAELRTFADQAKVGGGKLHLGATSMDIEDNADILLYRQAMDILTSRLLGCLTALREKIVKHRDTVCMAWTHLQPAEPTTLGYRFANYAQDLVLDIRFVEAVRKIFLLGKGVKGAVGTAASFKALLGNDSRVRRLEKSVMGRLGLESFEVSGQTYPRKVDYAVLVCLASIAQSCHKFGLDLRVMQSPAFGEWSEPIENLQVGSSAMPFKRNPVTAERMCSLSRLVSAMPAVAFSNAANSILERTLDDSAARRVAVPEAFLAVEECLILYERLVSGLRVYPVMVRKNLERFGPFAGTEAVMMKLAGAGGDRQKIHEMIRVRSSAAWEEVMKGKPNPIERSLAGDRGVSSKLTRKELKRLMEPTQHIGNAKEKCDAFVKGTVDPLLSESRRRRPATKSGF